MALGMSSCLTSKQKITITGEPGTEIYGFNNKKEFGLLGTVNQDGIAKIKVSRNNYTPYLLAKDNRNNQFYPFGLDFKYRNRGTDMTVFAVCAIPPISLFAYCQYSFYNSDQFDESYRYNEYQSIDAYIPNAKYANTGERRPLLGTKTKQKSTPETSSTSRLLRSNDYAKQVARNYTGKGKLFLDGETIENYSNMTITIERINKNTVAVNVLVDGSEAIFDSPMNYSVEKTNSGKFILTSDDDASSTITIDSNKHANYVNPNVEIDGETYKLQITAK
jgi:hypothetical protein